MGRTETRPGIAFATAALILAAGCTVNPATGKRELNLLSESREVELGRQSDPEIVAQFGLYPDGELQDYAARLGRALAARSERPGLPWTFRVLDDPLVNAFALPGGYIYVTRGILAHLNSEAELAGVLGHEIGHVTARHSASQISKAQLATLGLGLGAILAPERAEELGSLAQVGLGLLFLKYSRDDERQADDLGLRYMVRAGYDPRPMAQVFETLRRVGEDSKRGNVPGWLSTHPDPERREARVLEAIQRMSLDLDSLREERDAYLRRLDGLVFGEDPRQGFFVGSRFYHPEMRFAVDFPEGWRLQNTRRSVDGMSEARDALMRLTLAQQNTPEAALRAFLSQEGITPIRAAVPRPAGRVSAGSGFVAKQQQLTLQGLVVFVQHDGKVFQLLGYAVRLNWPDHRERIMASMASFRPVDDARVLGVRPARLRVVRTPSAMTLSGLARRFDASVTVDVLARINGVEPEAVLEAGRLYKIVEGGALPELP